MHRPEIGFHRRNYWPLRLSVFAVNFSSGPHKESFGLLYPKHQLITKSANYRIASYWKLLAFASLRLCGKPFADPTKSPQFCHTPNIS
jgi:hypothetical protein